MEGVIVYLILAVICVLYYFYYKKRENDNARKGTYYSLIMDSGIKSLDEIAAKANVSYTQAQDEIAKMISRGFFGSCHIDASTNQVVLAGRAATEEVSATCPTCGAINKVSYNNAVCEYCGTHLAVPKQSNLPQTYKSIRTCPKCGGIGDEQVKLWQVVVAIMFFPIGLLAFLSKKQNRCYRCKTWFK